MHIPVDKILQSLAEILSRLGDFELNLTVIRSSQKWEGAYFLLVTLFLREYIGDQALDLLPPVLERSCLCLKADTSLIGTFGTVKDMSKFLAE